MYVNSVPLVTLYQTLDCWKSMLPACIVGCLPKANTERNVMTQNSKWLKNIFLAPVIYMIYMILHFNVNNIIGNQRVLAKLNWCLKWHNGIASRMTILSAIPERLMLLMFLLSDKAPGALKLGQIWDNIHTHAEDSQTL